ncbi:MAG: ubiquinol-cytochrome c reductase cytochrome b subunit [Nitriliruptorales bacterium]|nr:ubiquinol-cytochrome c reductase cytochrome b subunit [Nitriliruptorales bacterium]
MIARLARYIDDRVRGGEYAKKGMSKVFPEHWSFLLGEIALYSFVILIATGIFLALFFKADWSDTTYQGSYAPLHGVEVSKSYDSTISLIFDVPAGALIRQIHHWAALVFLAAIVVHLLRIFFTGAFKRPRELNWIIGVTLLVLAIVEGFAGYSLPDDLLSGVGIRIGYSIAQSIPVVGSWLAFLVFGGEFPADEFVSRLYIGHVFVVPLIMMGLIGIHLFLVVRQKHTQFPGPGRTNDNVVGERLWPTYTAKSVGLFFLIAGVLAGMGGLFQINPIWLYGPYHPDTVTTFAQPDWYMGWVEGALRLMPSFRVEAFGYEIPNVFFSGVLVPGVTFGLMYLYPFIEQRLTGADRREHHLLDRPREHPWRTSLGVAILAYHAVLLAAGAQDILAEMTGASINLIIRTLQVLVFVLPIVAWVVTFLLCNQLQQADTYGARKAALRRREEDEVEVGSGLG